MKMIVSRMLMIVILSSLIVNSIAQSRRTFDCYHCRHCRKVDKHTPTEPKCGGCVKSVYHDSSNHVNRECVSTCDGIQQTRGVTVYCCRGNLCNSSSKNTLNATFIYSILFIAVTTIFYNN
ncbi:unnamed protein product [Trichobilharzia szidati]|nr:unnamed protein product [Trichobilharzia szidati]CAH8829482.1 unnamed protein product [Trichobilharzia szidati]